LIEMPVMEVYRRIVLMARQNQRLARSLKKNSPDNLEHLKEYL